MNERGQRGHEEVAVGTAALGCVLRGRAGAKENWAWFWGEGQVLSEGWGRSGGLRGGCLHVCNLKQI